MYICFNFDLTKQLRFTNCTKRVNQQKNDHQILMEEIMDLSCILLAVSQNYLIDWLICSWQFRIWESVLGIRERMC